MNYKYQIKELEKDIKWKLRLIEKLQEEMAAEEEKLKEKQRIQRSLASTKHWLTRMIRSILYKQCGYEVWWPIYSDKRACGTPGRRIQRTAVTHMSESNALRLAKSIRMIHNKRIRVEAFDTRHAGWRVHAWVE